jgi:hypothetical protein
MSYTFIEVYFLERFMCLKNNMKKLSAGILIASSAFIFTGYAYAKPECTSIMIVNLSNQSQNEAPQLQGSPFSVENAIFCPGNDSNSQLVWAGDYSTLIFTVVTGSTFTISAPEQMNSQTFETKRASAIDIACSIDHEGFSFGCSYLYSGSLLHEGATEN